MLLYYCYISIKEKFKEHLCWNVNLADFVESNNVFWIYLSRGWFISIHTSAFAGSKIVSGRTNNKYVVRKYSLTIRKWKWKRLERSNLYKLDWRNFIQLFQGFECAWEIALLHLQKQKFISKQNKTKNFCSCISPNYQWEML